MTAQTDVQSAMPSDLVDALDRITNLELAVVSNRRIGIATGIVMKTYLLTEQAAFEAMSRVSQRRNVKLRLVAENVILTGCLDGFQ